MCLVVNVRKHKRFLDCPLPKIALKKIPVVKYLDKCDNLYYTPFVRSKICFKNGKAIQKSKLDRADYITNGIHSAIENGLEDKRLPFSYYGTRKLVKKKAYIPIGALYYIGKTGDMVSSKLVILE